MISSKRFIYKLICIVLLFESTLACTNENANKYWFGTFITCMTSDYYTYAMAMAKCPPGEVLAQFMDASLYTNITQEITIRTE